MVCFLSTQDVGVISKNAPEPLTFSRREGEIVLLGRRCDGVPEPLGLPAESSGSLQINSRKHSTGMVNTIWKQSNSEIIYKLTM